MTITTEEWTRLASRAAVPITITKKDHDLWVKAMKSGQFKPSTGHLLSKNDGMCCLGVLCKVKGRLSDTGETTDKNGKVDFYLSSSRLAKYGDEFLFGLPMWVQEKLAAMNDETGTWPIESIENLPVQDPTVLGRL